MRHPLPQGEGKKTAFCFPTQSFGTPPPRSVLTAARPGTECASVTVGHQRTHPPQQGSMLKTSGRHTSWPDCSASIIASRRRCHALADRIARFIASMHAEANPPGSVGTQQQMQRHHIALRQQSRLRQTDFDKTSGDRFQGDTRRRARSAPLPRRCRPTTGQRLPGQLYRPRSQLPARISRSICAMPRATPHQRDGGFATAVSHSPDQVTAMPSSASSSSSCSCARAPKHHMLRPNILRATRSAARCDRRSRPPPSGTSAKLI